MPLRRVRPRLGQSRGRKPRKAATGSAAGAGQGEDSGAAAGEEQT